MARISREARFLFVLLWTVVDDCGRCHADPDDLAKVLYPHDFDVPQHIQLWLDELEREGCVERYEHEEIDYLHIVHWKKHQRIYHPTKSYLPAPPREALGGTPHGSPDDSAIRELSGKLSGRGRKIPRDQTLEERTDTFPENDDPFAREAAELASGGELTPERIKGYLDLALRRSIVANVQASPARYIEMAGKLHSLWGGRGAPPGKTEPQAPPEKRSLSPAEIHGLPEHTDKR